MLADTFDSIQTQFLYRFLNFQTKETNEKQICLSKIKTGARDSDDVGGEEEIES